MLTLYQRLIFGYVLVLALLVAVGVHDVLSLRQASSLDRQANVSVTEAARIRAGLAQRASILAPLCAAGGAVISVVFLLSIIRPIRRTAAAATRIGQGDLQQRVEWRTKD